MKKFLISLCALFLAFSASAQDSSTTTADSTSTSSKKSETPGSMVFEYVGVDDGWGLGYSFKISHIDIGMEYLFGDTDDYVTENSAFRVHLGYDYTYWIGNYFYIEGDAGLMFNHTEYRLKGEDTEKDNTFGFYITPRVGLKLFTLKSGTGIAVTASYRWDFNKFKTSSEYKADYFTIGIAATY